MIFLINHWGIESCYCLVNLIREVSEAIVPLGYSSEQIAWSIFDIMSHHQKLNLRDEIAERVAG